jgi:hypothetical protein
MFTIKFQLTNFKSKLLLRHEKHGPENNKKVLKQKRNAESSFNENKTNNWFFRAEKFFARFLSTALDGGRFQLENSQIIYGCDFVCLPLC